jgi:mRNA deadenylase 3'-5' endonuclease subunit Ccr4
VATYNLLATAYAQRAWYRRTPALVLDPAWRVPALVQQVSKLEADILCLQEVEPETFVALRTFLGERGYEAHYARKLAGRPEGCAILFRREAFEAHSVRSMAYADGAGMADSGYIALVARLSSRSGVLGLINTHLVWDPPDTAREAQRGLRQAQQLVSEYENVSAQARGWIIAGDVNAEPGSEIVSVITRAGLDYAHRELPDVATCNVGAKARLIDYLFHSPTLLADPIAPSPRIDDSTIMPSAEQPSDHIAIRARFEWRH